MKHKNAVERIIHAHRNSALSLDLSGMQLDYIPKEIGMLDKLEYLDLSHNNVPDLPDEILNLKSLKKLFLTKNNFRDFPSGLCNLESLEMFSLKSNMIERIPEKNYLPPSINWLILTDNKIISLPDDFGICVPRLRKFAMSGNKLEKLPDSVRMLSDLELIRISNNCFNEIPSVLFELPRLAWLAFSGNPFTDNLPSRRSAQQNLDKIKLDFSGYRIGDVLGSGASGVVYEATAIESPLEKLAIKMFKGLSSDGLPEDELAACGAVCAGKDVPDALIPVKGYFERPNFGLAMHYVDDARSLASVPSLVSITRDVYPSDLFSLDAALKILLNTARALEYAHGKNVCHGDFYAHNILVSADGFPSLGDWGASFFYPENTVQFEKIEVCAFGILARELYDRLELSCGEGILEIAAACTCEKVSDRPRFREIREMLERMSSVC